MRRKYCLTSALAFALAVPGATAALDQQYPEQKPQQRPQQERQRPGQEPKQQPQTQRTEPHQQQEQNIVRADRLIGQTVRNSQDERLGRINDLAVNLEDGKVQYVVVNRGGLWGIGGEEVAVPWQQIQPDQNARVVRVNAEQLQQARQIDTARNWPANIGDQPVGTTGAAPQQQGIVPMSNVIGMDVQNKQGERLGRIDEVALQRDGSIGYAVIAHGGFLGAGDKYVAVPWDRLNFDAQRELVMLDVTEQQLGNARAFEHRDSWPARVDWPFAGGR